MRDLEVEKGQPSHEGRRAAEGREGESPWPQRGEALRGNPQILLWATKEVIFPLALKATKKGRSFQVEVTTDARL